MVLVVCFCAGGKRSWKAYCTIKKERSKQDFFQAEDGIRDVERSRGLGDVYKRQDLFKMKSSN